MRNFYYVKEACNISGLSEYKIKKLFDEHRIFGYKDSKGHRKIDIEFLLRFLKTEKKLYIGTSKIIEDASDKLKNMVLDKDY